MSVHANVRHAMAGAVGFVALLVSVAAAGPIGGDDEVPGEGARGRAAVRLRVSSFHIGGDTVRPLSPGRSAPIDVRFTNPRNTPLTVTALRVRIRAVTAPNAAADRPCSRHDFVVRQVPASFAVTLAPRGSGSLSALGVSSTSWPRVRMVNRPTNQDGCKGASLRLAYRGSGTLQR